MSSFAQTYLVDSLNDAISYTQTVGAVWVGIVGQERGFDSTRDQGVVQAEYDCAVDSENAANAADQDAIAAWLSFASDAMGISASYSVARAGKEKDRQQEIADVNKTLLLTQNGAAETRALSETAADKTFADKQAIAWDTRRQSEAGEQNTVDKAEAAAEETRIKDIGAADAKKLSNFTEQAVLLLLKKKVVLWRMTSAEPPELRETHQHRRSGGLVFSCGWLRVLRGDFSLCGVSH